jgi:hypothetical protein
LFRYYAHGGLLVYGPDIADLFRRAGGYVDDLSALFEMTRHLPASSGPIVYLSGLSQECTQQKNPGDAGA